MGKLRHIAMQVPDPQKAAEFYMRVFGMAKVGETDCKNARGVYLSDGVINLALLDDKPSRPPAKIAVVDSSASITSVSGWMMSRQRAAQSRRQVANTGWASR